MKKKPDPLLAAQSTQALAPQLSEDELWWAEDPKREQAVKLLLQGMKKAPAARMLGVHRNTIDNWCKDSRFASELAKLHREHVSAKRQQRLISTNAVNDINERVTVALGQKIVQILKVDSEGKLRASKADLFADDFDRYLQRYRTMSEEFRETREQERIDSGDDVKNININSRTQHTITGDMHVTQHGVNETMFTDYVRAALDSKIIDAHAIEVPSNAGDGQLLLKTAEHLLVETDLLEQISAEDIAAEEAGKK